MLPYVYKGSQQDIHFVGRNRELHWLDETLLRENPKSIIITGVAGIGKTSLVKHWLSSRKIPATPLWLDLTQDSAPKKSIDNFIAYLREDRPSSNYIVVVDGSEGLSEREYDETTSRILNYKAVSKVIFTTRKAIAVRNSDLLRMSELSVAEAIDLFNSFLPDQTNKQDVRQAVDSAGGIPLAVELMSKLVQVNGTETIASLLAKPLYELPSEIELPKQEIISTVKPIIVSASQTLITSLQRQPEDLRNLSPREFEKLLADLLSDMGWDVELTKQTRDGGADILAYLNTGVGRLLCLVEAKHYREDRKIGIDLVRSLYGTLCDAQANCAMLVTSSSFSKDAREFQQKHQYQLSLRDYADIVDWILKYGKGQVRPSLI